MKKIDIFNHIWPENYYNKLKGLTDTMMNITMRSKKAPMITSLDDRFRVMDMFDDYCQIPSLASPPLELVADEGQARMLVIANCDDKQCNKQQRYT